MECIFYVEDSHCVYRVSRVVILQGMDPSGLAFLLLIFTFEASLYTHSTPPFPNADTVFG